MLTYTVWQTENNNDQLAHTHTNSQHIQAYIWQCIQNSPTIFASSNTAGISNMQGHTHTYQHTKTRTGPHHTYTQADTQTYISKCIHTRRATIINGTGAIHMQNYIQAGRHTHILAATN